MPYVDEWRLTQYWRKRDSQGKYIRPPTCGCSAIRELALSPEDRQYWLEVCPACAPGIAAAEGLPFVPGVGFAAGSISAAAADAGYKPIVYTPPPPVVFNPTPPASQDPRGTGVSGGPSIYPEQERPQQYTGGFVNNIQEEAMRAEIGLSPASPLVLAPPSQDFLGGLVGAIGGGIGGFLTGGPAGAVAGAIGGAYTGSGGGRERTTSPGTTSAGLGLTGGSNACPTGYRWDGTRCVQEGIGGVAARILPGGNTGVYTGGATGINDFGMLYEAPNVVAIPTSRCRAGYVLGRDGMCYAKGTIQNRMRKWPKGTRPLLTGGEMKTLRKVKSLENKVKRAWQAAGSPGKPRPRSCKTPTRRK